MLKSLDFVMLHVPNVETARAFYTEKLGFGIADQQPGFVQFERGAGGAIFAVVQSETTPSYAGFELWWDVADADATYADLTGKGVPALMPPTDMPFGRAFTLQDPFGHELHFFAPQEA